MKHCICSGCFGQAVFLETGHDIEGRKFDLYYCDDCKNYTRDFNLTEREVVEHEIERESRVSLEPRALSGNLRQLRMFPAARVTD